MKLFEDNTENYDIPFYRPDYYKIYSTTNDSIYLKQKKIMELWFNKIESPTKKKELKSSIKNAFFNSFFEIVTHEILLSQGVKINEIELENKTPDFIGFINKKLAIFEATTLESKENRNKAYFNKRGDIINTLDNLKIDGIKLELINLHIKCKHSPNLSLLIRKIEEKYDEADEFGTKLVYKSEEFDVKINIYKFKEDKGKRGKLMMIMHMGAAIEDNRLYEKIKKKVLKYKDSNLPIYVFVNLLSNDCKEYSILYNLKRNTDVIGLSTSDKSYLTKLRNKLSKLSKHFKGVLITNVKPYNIEDTTSIFINCQNESKKENIFTNETSELDEFIKMFNIRETLEKETVTNTV